MATISYDEHATLTNVKVTPASDAEVITITLGFHPTSMTGVKLKDSDEVATIYWNQQLTSFVMLVGSDMGGAGGYENIAISTCIGLYGPTPLVGVGVSKERTALGITVYGALVTDSIDLHMTFHR